MTTTDEHPAQRRSTLPRPDRQSGLVVAMTVALAALAVLVGLPFVSAPVTSATLGCPGGSSRRASPPPRRASSTSRLKREAQTVSISELALVLGLFYATPLDLLMGHLIGSAAILLLHRRSSVLKTVWNLGSLSLQVAVAVALFHLVAGAHGETHWLAWLGAYAGCLGACGRGESNPHARRHQILSLAWLPLHHSRVGARSLGVARRVLPPAANALDRDGIVWQAVAVPRDPRQIQLEIDAARESLAATLDQLVYRAAPRG
jgi:hypothetical protein